MQRSFDISPLGRPLSAFRQSCPGTQRCTPCFPSQPPFSVLPRVASAQEASPNRLQRKEALSGPWQALCGGSKRVDRVGGPLLAGRSASRGTSLLGQRLLWNMTPFAGPSRDAPGGSHTLEEIAPLQDAGSPMRVPGQVGDAEPQKAGRGRRSRRNQQSPGGPQSLAGSGDARPTKSSFKGQKKAEPTLRPGDAGGGGPGGARAAEAPVEADAGMADRREGGESAVDEFVEVAEIGAPFGVKGWLRAKPITDAPEERLGTPGTRSVRYPAPGFP